METFEHTIERESTNVNRMEEADKASYSVKKGIAAFNQPRRMKNRL